MRLTRLFLIIAAAFHVSPVWAQPQGCWGNFRGDARLTGVSDASLPDQPALLWNFNTQEGIKAAPVVCDGVIVAGTVNGKLFGINDQRDPQMEDRYRKRL